MATAPLPGVILTRIKARSQSVRWVAILREVRRFESYFCAIDVDTIVGVTFPPTVNISIIPNPICLGNSMAWDLSGSYAPGSSVSSYAIDFGDSNDDTGVSGNHTYATAGEFTVTVTVTSAAGLTQTSEKEVNVIDCTSPLILTEFYSSTDGSGVFHFLDVS